MNKQIEALKMAIEAMECVEREYGWEDLLLPVDFNKSLQACKEALAEAEKQEPVAWVSEVTLENIEWVRKQDTNNCLEIFCCCDKWDDNNVPLYTHPATWQSLSDDEIDNIWSMNFEFGFRACARAIEQALKEKNLDSLSS